MRLLWPGLLPLFLLVPILILLYWWILRRHRRFAVRYSSLSLIREALPDRARWRRHLPAALFLVGLTSLIAALTRPAAQVLVPLSRTTIILAIDVSRSMCASDVPPNRLTVAQEAASKFVEQQADDTRIGIVAFADFAEVIVPPTNDKQKLIDALASLTTSLGTAIGNATLKGLDAIASVNPAVAPSGVNLGGQSGGTPAGSDYQPDIIVLLTDGANTRGPSPVDAAAAGRRPPRARVHHRLRDDRFQPDGVHVSSAGQRHFRRVPRRFRAGRVRPAGRVWRRPRWSGQLSAAR